jgi:hypothetical protein
LTQRPMCTAVAARDKDSVVGPAAESEIVRAERKKRGAGGRGKRVVLRPRRVTLWAWEVREWCRTGMIVGDIGGRVGRRVSAFVVPKVIVCWIAIERYRGVARAKEVERSRERRAGPRGEILRQRKEKNRRQGGSKGSE